MRSIKTKKPGDPMLAVRLGDGIDLGAWSTWLAFRRAPTLTPAGSGISLHVPAVLSSSPSFNRPRGRKMGQQDFSLIREDWAPGLKQVTLL